MTARTTRAVRMHDVSISLDEPASIAARDATALDALLSHFEPEDPAAHVASPRLCVHVDEHVGPPTFSAPEWSPQFFFGVTQGFVGERGYALCDARSSSVVDVHSHEIKISLVRTANGALAPTTTGLCHASLCLALREHALFELHAAAVVRSDRAFVILGNSGAGKTSLALSLLTDPGSAYLGDDRVLIRSRAGGALWCAYPRTFHLALGTATALPALLSRARHVDGIGGKLALDPSLAFAQRFVSSWSGSTVLLLPRVEPVERTHVRLVPAAQALGALIESSALAWVDGIRHRQQNLALLGAIANRTAAFAVALGRDALRSPAEIAASIVDHVERECPR